MDKPSLDLATLEVEHLDIAVVSLNGGLEEFGMGHAATELSQSCNSGFCEGETCDGSGTSCACSSERCDGD